MKRLLTYLNPHKKTMALATLLVLFIIVVELYRPIIIGNAIDDHINGYYHPYAVTAGNSPGAVAYKDLWLTREFDPDEASQFYQIFLWQDRYYMAENVSRDECALLEGTSPEILSQYVGEGAVSLEKEDLAALRRYDFTGILTAAFLYLSMLLLGFVLNALDTWMLQKMGQIIIYEMRKEVLIWH